MKQFKSQYQLQCHVCIDHNIGWSTHDCQISNFTETDDEQRSSIMEPTENSTTKGLKPTVYETKFYQPGYFGLILVMGRLCQ